MGRAYCDLIFTDVPRMPSMGTEVFAGGLGVHAGGGAPIAAAHVAAAGRDSFLAATLPQGPFGGQCAVQLLAVGVDLSLCQEAAPDSDPQVTMAIVGADDRAFLTRRVGVAAPALTVDDLAGLGLVHLHIGELTTLVEMPGLIALARAAGLTLSLDCAWDDANDPARAAPLIAQMDVFLPNATEAAWLADSGIAAPFAPLTVIKRGPDGAVALRGAERVEGPAAAVHPVDTTGAGDAFDAGFLDRWLDGAPLADCLAAGNAAGARAIAIRGGFAARTTDARAGTQAATA